MRKSHQIIATVLSGDKRSRGTVSLQSTKDKRHGCRRSENQRRDAGKLETSHRSEVRPSKQNADGSLKPFYLKRTFKYLPSDRFELEVVDSADPYGAVPLARIMIGGHMLWRGSHPVASG